MALHIKAIAGTVLVIHAGEEGLHGLHVRFLHPGKLPKLQHPIPLQFLRACLVAHIRERQAVGEPCPRKPRKERGLADALRPVQDEDGIELHPRLVYPRHGRRQRLPHDRPCVYGILRAEVVCKERVDALRAVPLRQGVKVLTHRVVCPLRCHRKQGVLRLGGRIYPIAFVEVHFQGCEVRVVPPRLDLLPRKALPGIYPVPVQVEGDGLHPPVMAHDQHEVVQRVPHHAPAVKLQ